VGSIFASQLPKAPAINKAGHLRDTNAVPVAYMLNKSVSNIHIKIKCLFQAHVGIVFL
jgi:hypothetical protein